MIGSDKKILNVKKEDLLTKTKGRPEVNRDLALRLFKSKYSTKQISTYLKCSVKTVRRIKKELIELGELNQDMVSKEAPLIEADFDQECQRATGLSFLGWLKTKQKSYIPTFNFCSSVWIGLWEKPSLVQLKDVNDQLGDQLCQKFLNFYQEDITRIRRRKVHIRALLRFIGRHDLCDRHLTVSASRDPKNKRPMPIIEMRDFPTKFNEFIESKLDEELKFIVKLKCVAQMRTGDLSDERGFFGIKRDEGQSYLIMNSIDDYRLHVKEKLREYWDITHLPRELREILYEIYLNKNTGEPIFIKKDQVKQFGILTKKYLGVKMHFHDLRKISVTWYYALGVPLEIATMINVGWKDLNTPREHYLHLRQLLKKNEKKDYAKQIPSWFKEGIEEYLEE